MTVLETIEARSRQPLWPILVLAPAAALLFWMVGESSAPAFAQYASGSLLGALPSAVLAIFFGACGGVCVVCVAIALWRRSAPQDDLVLGADGVESRLFWGPGFLAYGAITATDLQRNWLFIHGVDPRGRKRRLIVDVTHLDHPAGALIETLHDRARAAHARRTAHES